MISYKQYLENAGRPTLKSSATNAMVDSDYLHYKRRRQPRGDYQPQDVLVMTPQRSTDINARRSHNMKFITVGGSYPNTLDTDQILSYPIYKNSYPQVNPVVNQVNGYFGTLGYVDPNSDDRPHFRTLFRRTGQEEIRDPRISFYEFPNFDTNFHTRTTLPYR